MSGEKAIKTLETLSGSKSISGMSKLGLTIKADVSLQEYIRLGKLLLTMRTTSHWWVGDWLYQSEKVKDGKVKDSIAELEIDLGYAIETLTQYRRVAGRIPEARRRGDLSFYHHRAVCSLNEELQDKFLVMASKQHLTVEKLEYRVRKHFRISHRSKVEEKEPLPDDMFEEKTEQAPPDDQQDDVAANDYGVDSDSQEDLDIIAEKTRKRVESASTAITTLFSDMTKGKKKRLPSADERQLMDGAINQFDEAVSQYRKVSVKSKRKK